MKTRFISLTLAGLMSTQGLALASTDRTQGIGDNAILNAQASMATVQQQILALDASLAKTAEAIEARDNSGGIMNGLSIGGAAIGMGLSTLTYFALKSRGDSGAGAVVGLLIYVGSIGAAVSSSVVGMGGEALRPDVNTANIEAQVAAAQQQVVALQSQSSDKAAQLALNQVSASLKGMSEALTTYQDKQNSKTRTKLVAQSSQLLGAAISAYAIRQRNPAGIMVVGPLLMNLGNLVNIVSGMTSEQADKALTEIKKTREALKMASTGLQ